MIVLGQKYRFHPLEKEQIQKLFPDFKELHYSDKSSEEILRFIEQEIDSNHSKLIVLNTKVQIPNEIIARLTHLQFEQEINYITIEHFLEKYLNKCYIPEEQRDISFLEKIKPFSPLQYLIKRCVDFSITIPLGIIILPIVIYTIYRIRKESPDGPVLFKQKRVGKNGREFECIKFRSMRTDVNYFNHYTQKDDPRIFPWGAIMRKTRLDELPQLINVIKGEMHLIGPRAEWNELVAKYEEKIPFYNERHLIAPGITGWAQVMYPYGANVEDARQKLMYDLYYIKNWSLWLELKTAIKTILVMLGKKGL